METYRENTRPITPPSDNHNKRASGNLGGVPIPNLQNVDQTMPTTATSNIPQSTTTPNYPVDSSHSSSPMHSGSNNHRATGHPTGLKNVDAIDPTYSANLRGANEDGFLGRNAPQHNLSPNTVPNSHDIKPLEKRDNSPNSAMHRQFGSQRNETTHRIEREVYQILHWKKPVRSGIALSSIVGSILLTRWYSLLQLSAAGLTMATLINLIYVNFMVQGQKIISNDQTSQHPYKDVIHNENSTYINRDSVNHYTTVFMEVSETIIRAMTRIVFVEDTLTSMKWMSIFFIIWKVSAHVSTMNIILTLAISAFIFPRLYMSNKDIVDSQIQKSQKIIQTGLNKAQTVAQENAKDIYGKTRAYVAQVGTTGTDAKNTLNNTSTTLKGR